MKNIVLFGPPGAGKGTQAELLKGKYNLVHISTGDVFRFNIKNETELGILAKTFMDKGDLVPDEVTINMLEAEVDKNTNANGFIFDGFPRTKKQAELLSKFIASLKLNLSAAILIDVEQPLLIERILNRSKIEERNDDNEEILELDNFCEECKKEDQSVSQNLILTGFKNCNSCKLSKTIFPI